MCLHSKGMSKEAGAQTGPGFLPAEASPAPHQIPAAAKGQTESSCVSHTYCTHRVNHLHYVCEGYLKIYFP